MKFEYPVPRRDESILDNYHGTKILDPYRWMEDPDNDETKKFVDEQNAITRPYLDGCPGRSNINSRLTELWNYPRYSCPYQHGEYVFYYANSGLQNQSVLYKQKGDSEPTVFLDPNELSYDGTVAIKVTAFSEDDKIFAYGLSSCGSDWNTVRFKSVDTGEIYPETLEKVKFSSLAWTHDNKGVFYACYIDQSGKTDGSETELNKNQKLYYHVVGTSQKDDVLAVEFPEEPEYLMGCDISVCGRYLIITPQKGCKDNLVYVSDLHKLPNGKVAGKLDLIPVITKLESDYEYITNTGPVFVFRTNKNAPNYHLVKIHIENPEEDKREILISEHERDVLEWAELVYNDKLILCYIQDVKNVLQMHDVQTGKLLHIFPVEAGTIGGFSGDKKYKDIYYHFVSYLSPGIIYHCDLSETEMTPKVYRDIKLNNFDRSKFTVEQVFYKSKDGTKIPMYIMHKKNLKKDGNNPCMLYGYGGFNVSLLPYFGVSKIVFMDNMNGVYAIPNIRGGGEYGEKWHNGGRFGNKQNCFDDFHAAAQYLIDERFTSSQLLCINGGSNGGLLVAACANQRPDLYGAVIANVGVLDMLRFHKFTIGYSWITDYGNAEIKDNFDYLIKYSPLHNIKVPDDPAIQYPATLLLTADHDDRVVPLHSLKFIATLQHTFRNNPKQKNPLLIRVETKAGHGNGKPIGKVVRIIQRS